MRISILDDYRDTLRTFRCFQKLADHQVPNVCAGRSSSRSSVLAEAVSKPDRIVIGREAAPAPPLRWDPVRPLTGPGDWLARVRWVAAAPDRDLRRWLRPANGRLPAGAPAAAGGWEIAIPQRHSSGAVLRDGTTSPGGRAADDATRSGWAAMTECK